MRRKDLERALEAMPAFPAALPGLEQYRTPAAIAAGLLWAAHEDGAIAGRDVLDLGCGTGTFAVGAALLGARKVLGVDVDAGAVALAREAAASARAAASFEVQDLASWQPEPSWDTVVMNPPFGAQAGNRHGDRLFLERALQAIRPGGTVWFLALTRTERFLAAWAGERHAPLERVAAWDYPLEATMAHHRKEAHVVEVGAYRLGHSRR